jgi:hypothetical protein
LHCEIKIKDSYIYKLFKEFKYNIDWN